MSNLLRNIVNPGFLTNLSNQGRNAHTLSNGNALVTFTDGPNLYVYESTDRTNWTLRQTVALGSAPYYVTTALFADNSIGVAFTTSINSILGITYFKITYSGFTVSAFENVFGASAAYNWLNGCPIDMDVSDGGLPYISFMFANGQAGVYNRFANKLSNGTWQQTGDIVMFSGGSGSVYPNTASTSIVALGAVNGVRNVVVVSETQGTDARSGYAYPFDSGTFTFTARYTESTGAITEGPTTRIPGAGASESELIGAWRKYRLFRNVDRPNQYILAVIAGDLGGGPAKNMCRVYKANYDGTTFSRDPRSSETGAGAFGQVQFPPNESVNVGASTAVLGKGGTVAFLLQATNQGSIRFGSMILRWYGQFENAYETSTWRFWDNADNANYPQTISGGGWRNSEKNYYDTFMIYTDKARSWYAQQPKELTSFSPTDGQTGISATPDLTGVITGVYDYAQANFRVDYQFSLDPTFASGVREYFTTPWLDVHASKTSGKSYSDRLSNDLALPGGLWYVRARLQDMLGNVGIWFSDGRRFSVGHPPTATAVSPVDNQYYEFGDGTKSLTWKFSDTSQTDVQTAYQVRVKKASDNTIVIDTGKVSGATSQIVVTIPSAQRNVGLYWEVRLWDTNDSAGDWSHSNSYFQMVDPASAVISSPTDAQVLTNGIPTITATFSTTGVRVVKEWIFTVSQAGSIIWRSKRAFGSIPNNGTTSATIPNNILKNNQTYTTQVRFVDDAGLENASPPRTFSTLWAVPGFPSTVGASASHYNVDNEGWVEVTWNDANRETNFAAWIVYRKVSLLDQVTGAVTSTGPLVEVGRVYSISQAGYTFRDYMAPSGQSVTYVIHQLVNRNAFLVESENTTGASVTPLTDSYWLIDALESNAECTRLYLVTGDSFTDEQEESVYNVIGRGRHVDKGQYLGVTGTLDIRLRHTGGISARAKRLKLIDLQKRNKPLYMRNPFGDVYKVNVSSMQVGRVNGVGLSEFCDVQIPYQEVG